MKQRTLGTMIAAMALVLLTGCGNEVPSGPRNLLPDLEERTRYGFNVDEAKHALEEVKISVDTALENGLAFKDLDFDVLNELSPEVAIVERTLKVAMLGGAATVAGLDNSGTSILAAAYGDGGYCFYLRITEGSPMKVERGIGFSATCAASEPASSITWSTTEEFPDTTKVQMPTSSVEVGGSPDGQPATSPTPQTK